MNVFRNKAFTKRNYECTNIAACEVLPGGSLVSPLLSGFEPADESILTNMQPLWIEGGIRYWGWL